MYEKTLEDLPRENKMKLINRWIDECISEIAKYENQSYKYNFVWLGNRLNELKKRLDKLTKYRATLK